MNTATTNNHGPHAQTQRVERIVARLTRYIEEEILGGDGSDLDQETPLLKLGILDSIELVSLLAFIEDELGVIVDTAKLRPENFGNIGAIAHFLDAHPDANAVDASPQPAAPVSEPGSTMLRSDWVRVAEHTRLHLLRRAARVPSSTPWLCIPALGTPAKSWRPLIQALDPEAELVSVDLAGFGVSETTREAPSFGAHVEMISTYLNLHASGPVQLVGSSAGGLIAAELARRHPHMVRSMTLIGVGKPEQPETWGAPDTPIHDPEVLGGVFDGLFADSAEAVMKRPAYRGFMDELAVELLRSGFDQLEVPTAFIHGSDDPLVPLADAQRACAHTPGASLEVIAGCGHFPHVERAEAVASLLAGR